MGILDFISEVLTCFPGIVKYKMFTEVTDNGSDTSLKTIPMAAVAILEDNVEFMQMISDKKHSA